MFSKAVVPLMEASPAGQQNNARFFAVNINSFFSTCVLSLFKSPVLSVYQPIFLAIMLISTITKSHPINILTQGLFIDNFYGSVFARAEIRFILQICSITSVTNYNTRYFIIIYIFLINNDFLKHKQANINVKSRRFGIIMTPFSRQNE